MKKAFNRVIGFILAVAIVLKTVIQGKTVKAATPIADGRGRTHDHRFDDYERVDGIDVSYAQGDIDWKKVKAAGIKFAFIRVGGRGYGLPGNMYFDETYMDNVKGALENGIEVGLYFFSQALTEKEAADEAKQLLEYLHPKQGTYPQLRGGIPQYLNRITLPIVMDYEYSPSQSGRFLHHTLSKSQATKNVEAFVKVIKGAGYRPCLYASASFLEDQVDADRISTMADIWLAHYTDATDYDKDYTYWQYTSIGRIDGIDEYVDLDVWYTKVKRSNVQCVKDTYKGVTGWYAERNGKILPNYTGFAKNSNGWFYVKNGKVDFSISNVIKGEINGRSGWWHVKNAKVIFSDTVAKNEYGWWRIRDGKVDFNYTGASKNEYGWWRIVGGKVDFQCNSVIKNENGWFRCKGGKVDFGFNGLARNEYGWWYCRTGKVDFSYCGLAKNEYGWWYVKDGRVRFDFNGMAENQYGTFLCRNGKVDFNYTGMFYSNYGYSCYVVNGRVVDVYY